MMTLEMAPDVALVDSTGRDVRLSDYWQQQLTAFTFIRYLGCIFCREQVKEMRDHAAELEQAGLQVVLIAPARPDAAAEFVADLRLPFTMLTDPRREAYRAYGLTEGTRGQLINTRIVTRAASAMLHGTMPGKPDSGLAKQLPGTAIVDTDGRLRMMQAATDASDHMTTKQLLDAAESIRRESGVAEAVPA